MLSDLIGAFKENSEALQALAALASVLILFPSAVIFFINQNTQRRILSEDGHRYAIQQYREYLSLCLENADLSLETGTPRASVSAQDRVRRDILFDMLTSTFERAHTIYRGGGPANVRGQWRGWVDYMAMYAERHDYLEWWKRIVLEGDLDKLKSTKQWRGSTQYNLKFEAFMMGIVAPKVLAAERDGSLAQFEEAPLE